MKRKSIPGEIKRSSAVRRAAAGKAVTIALAFALVVSCSFGAYAQSNQDKLDDVQSQQQEAEAKKEEILAQLDEAQTKVDDLTAQVDSAQSEIDSKQAEIDELNAQIEETQKSIDDRENGIAARLRVMYKNGSASFLDILLSSRNLSEFLSNADLLQRIYKSDKEILNDLEANQEAIKKSRDEIQAAQDQLVAAQNELKTKQAEASRQRPNSRLRRRRCRLR